MAIDPRLYSKVVARCALKVEQGEMTSDDALTIAVGCFPPAPDEAMGAFLLGEWRKRARDAVGEVESSIWRALGPYLDRKASAQEIRDAAAEINAARKSVLTPAMLDAVVARRLRVAMRPARRA
jgi:hypothetical protein